MADELGYVANRAARMMRGARSTVIGLVDHKGIPTATSPLLELGHRRIAYIGGTTDIPTAAARLAGFEEAIKDAGLAQGVGVTELGPPSSTAHGADALRRLMAAPESP